MRRRRRRRRRVRRRRILLVGGLVAFGAYKMSKRHAKQIEEHTGTPPEELDDQELEQAMDDLNIPKEKVTSDDREEAGGGGGGGGTDVVELEKLAKLHDEGVLTDEEFTAAKKKALGI